MPGAGPPATDLASRLVARIRRQGPIRFDDYMAAALYDPEGGFFATGGGAGRRNGDFLTSPEVGPLFGEVVARALDTWWDELDRPDPYLVVDAGAGQGTLARSILQARPRCLHTLRYVLVEASASLRAQHARGLPLEPPETAFAGAAASMGDDDEDARVVAAAPGPICVSLAELPLITFDGVVLANELLDNLPFRVFEGEAEVLVGERDGRFVELTVPAGSPLGPAVTGRHPVQTAATDWLRQALSLVRRGRVCVIDYGDDTATLAERGGWLRTYRAHARGGDPLDAPGTQDITADVCVDQLAAVRPPTTDRSQAEFLRAHGLDELVEEGRRVWAVRAHVGDLDALKARSRVREAEALCDPAGLGGFRVWEWVRR